MDLDVYRPLIFLGLMAVCVLGFHGGILYAVGFLRRHEIVDMRPLEFVAGTLFGRFGENYSLFHKAHSHLHGAALTRLLIAAHLFCAVAFWTLPFLFLE